MFRNKPQRVDQDSLQTCWAAAMTSFVKSSPNYYDKQTRNSVSKDGFVDYYSDLPGGALKPLSEDTDRGLIPLVWDYKLVTASYGHLLGQSLSTFVGNVLRNGSYVVITYRSYLDQQSNFMWWHAVVGYGVSGSKISVMDPNRSRAVYLTRDDGKYQLIFHESAS
jgi:hypothetical protein